MSTLETIPEETSQVETKITSSNPEKVKDPRRVAAGKRLAAISKTAKEKTRERFEVEMRDSGIPSWDLDWGFLVGSVGVLTAVGALYFAYRQERREVDRETDAVVPQSSRGPARARVDLDTFD